MKKIILVLAIILALFTLTGCTDSDYYPYVRVFRTVWKSDNFDIHVPPGMILDESMPYRFDYDTNTLTIYFVKENL